MVNLKKDELIGLTEVDSRDIESLLGTFDWPVAAQVVAVDKGNALAPPREVEKGAVPFTFYLKCSSKENC